MKVARWVHVWVLLYVCKEVEAGDAESRLYWAGGANNSV